MEFPELGKNCSWLPCKELDFLPMTCLRCNLVFCKNHIHIDHHKCSKAECDRQEQVSVETFICSSDGCKSYSAVEMKCPKCQKHFCLEHRHHGCFEATQEEMEAKKVLWDAPKQQFARSLNEVNKIVSEGIKKSLQNPKKKEAAQKINLMCLKAKAQGPAGIPVENRIYFSVLFPKGSKTQSCKTQSVFTSKDWSVGRVIDSLSEVLNIQNKNNVANAKKLRLFKRLDGLQIATDMSEKIGDLISKKSLINGEMVILEYVSPDEDLMSYKLNNFEEYKES